METRYYFILGNNDIGITNISNQNKGRGGGLQDKAVSPVKEMSESEISDVWTEKGQVSWFPGGFRTSNREHPNGRSPKSELRFRLSSTGTLVQKEPLGTRRFVSELMNPTGGEMPVEKRSDAMSGDLKSSRSCSVLFVISLCLESQSNGDSGLEGGARMSFGEPVIAEESASAED